MKLKAKVLRGYFTGMLAVTGLALITFGLWQISPPWALVIVGVLLVADAIWEYMERC